MKNLHQAIEELIEPNSFLKIGFAHKVFNLAKLSVFLKPLLEFQLKKTLSEDSVHMQLSRIQRITHYEIGEGFDFKVSGVHMQPNLCICIFNKNGNVRENVIKYSTYIYNKNGYFINTESLNKITIIFENTYLDIMGDYISDKPIEIFTDITGVSSRFQRNNRNQPGFLYALTQQLYFQNINIVEVISSDTEIIFYINDSDAKRSFDTIFNTFSTPNSILLS